MNGFNLSNISDLYVGSAKASAIYKGSTLIWQAATDYSKEYFTIESLEDNNTIYFTNVAMDARTISWSIDKTTWTNITTTQNTASTITTLNTGDVVYIKGTTNNYGKTWTGLHKFESTGQFNAYGNIMSILYGDNFIGKTTLSKDCALWQMFIQSKITDASNLILPATNSRNLCYSNMFNGCTYLTYAPQIYTTTVGYQSHTNMFTGCTSLTAAPVLYATNMDMYSYREMFDGCTSLNYVEVYSESLGTSGFDNWLRNVSPTGTFKKSANMTLFPTGASGIPSGWTVIDV